MTRSPCGTILASNWTFRLQIPQRGAARIATISPKSLKKRFLRRQQKTLTDSGIHSDCPAKAFSLSEKRGIPPICFQFSPNFLKTRELDDCGRTMPDSRHFAGIRTPSES
jgi:hypothetical protein